MDVVDKQKELERYRRESGNVIIEVAVRNAQQLFNERDPAPFPARDLDENFVTYVLTSVQEFPLKTEMRLRIIVSNERDDSVDKNTIREAIKTYFTYEAELARTKLRKRLRTARWFLLIGLLTLFACLGIAEMFRSLLPTSPIATIGREGFVIIGWVAMWRPIEVILYDWWPLREQKLHLLKIANMSADVVCLA